MMPIPDPSRTDAFRTFVQMFKDGAFADVTDFEYQLNELVIGLQDDHLEHPSVKKQQYEAGFNDGYEEAEDELKNDDYWSGRREGAAAIKTQIRAYFKTLYEADKIRGDEIKVRQYISDIDKMWAS
jgi:hypothetical protein